MMDPAAARWRKALLETLETVPDYAPLLLSGGMDSLTLLAGSLALGRRPQCWTVYADGYADRLELKHARAAAEDHGLIHRVILTPTGDEEMIALTKDVIRLTGSTRKTVVQCCYGVLPVFRRMIETGVTDVVTGTGGIAEDNRKAKILGADYEGNREELEAMRRRNLLGGDPESATEGMKALAVKLGLTPWEPYSMAPCATVALDTPWPEMNRPMQKGIAVRAFPDFFYTPGGELQYWKPNASLQVAGGIRELHERLLRLPLNRRHAQRVVAIYNDMKAEMEDGEQLVLG